MMSTYEKIQFMTPVRYEGYEKTNLKQTPARQSNRQRAWVIIYNSEGAR